MHSHRAFGGVVLAIVAAWSVVAVASIQRSAQTPAPARETSAEFPGVRLWYRDTGGAGVPVIFLHAATGSTRNWANQEPVFTAAGYRFVAYDRRGWGRSSVDAPGAPPSTGADDLRLLVGALGIDRFHLVATAGGAFVAIDYALSFPQQLRSLVIANSIGGVQDEEFLALGRRLRPSQFDALPPDLRELGPAYRAANPEGTARWLELERASRPNGPLPTPQRMKNRVTFALLETISVPTLLLTGGADMYAPPAVTRLFARRIKNSTTLFVPDTGHSTYWEEPEVFNRAVLEFIRKH